MSEQDVNAQKVEAAYGEIKEVRNYIRPVLDKDGTPLGNQAVIVEMSLPGKEGTTQSVEYFCNLQFYNQEGKPFGGREKIDANSVEDAFSKIEEVAKKTLELINAEIRRRQILDAGKDRVFQMPKH